MQKIMATEAATNSGGSAFAQTFTLKSRELGGQLTNKQYANGMGFNGENKTLYPPS